MDLSGLMLLNTIGAFENPILFVRGNDSQRLAESKAGMSKQLGFWDPEEHRGTISAKGDPLEKLATATDLVRFRTLPEKVA